METNPELYLKKIKSLWIALLIDFWTRTEFLNLETNSELDLKKKNRPELYLKKIKSLWIALWIGFQTTNIIFEFRNQLRARFEQKVDINP